MTKFMTASLRRLTALPLAALVMFTAACSDVSTAPSADIAGPAFGLSGSNGSSYIVSQTPIGDTTVTVFVLGTNAKAAATFPLGNDSKIDFPYAASSVCDIASSSYGTGTWDSPCTASSQAVVITAKTWTNARGQVESDFQPAMRFVPGGKKMVSLTLKYAYLAGARIDFRMANGTLVNEGLTDASLLPTIDAASGKISRIIKHFSGYTVTAD